MSFARDVARNTIIQFAGKVLGTGFGLLTTAIILRYLHPAGYGHYTTVMAYLGFFSVVADLGLYLIVIRDLNKPGADPAFVIGNLLGLRWVSAGVILGAGALLVWLLPYTGAEKTAIAIGTLSFVAVAATQLFVGLFQSRLAMGFVAAAELLGRMVLLGGTVAVVHYHGTLNALLAVVVVGSAANLLLVWLSARRYVMLRPRYDRQYWRSTLRDTFPIALSIVLNLIYFRADTIILRFMKSSYDVGLYGAAYKVLEILNTFPIMFVGLLLPALGAAFSGNDRERFRHIYQRGFDLLLMAIVPLLIGGWMLAQPALVALGQAEYAPAAQVLRLLLVAVAALFLNSLSGHTITIINRQRQMVWTYLGVAVVGLAVYLTLIPRWSFYGAAIGTIVTETLTAIVGYILVLRVMKFSLRLTLLPRLLAAGAAMGLVLYLLRGLNFWVLAPLGVAVYVAGLILVRAVTPAMVKEIISQRGSSVRSIGDS